MGQEVKQELTRLQQCVSDAELSAAFEGILHVQHNTNKRNVLNSSVIRVGSGCACSFWMSEAMHTLGLIRKPTARGKQFLTTKGFNYLGLLLSVNLSAHCKLVTEEGYTLLPSAVQELVSDSECKVAVANANYGEWSPRQVVNQGVFSLICQTGMGHVQWSTLAELGLANKPRYNTLPRPTRKGLQYLRILLMDRVYRHLYIVHRDSKQ